jgi:hypothetical protein
MTFQLRNPGLSPIRAGTFRQRQLLPKRQLRQLLMRPRSGSANLQPADNFTWLRLGARGPGLLPEMKDSILRLRIGSPIHTPVHAKATGSVFIDCHDPIHAQTLPFAAPILQRTAEFMTSRSHELSRRYR